MATTIQYNPQPLGAVTVVTPGTKVRLTINLLTADPTTGKVVTTAATDSVPCNKIGLAANPLSQAGAGNTGKVYIGSQSMSRTTLLGVVAIILPGGSYSITNNVSMNIYDASQWYVDADNAGDSIYGSFDMV